MPITSSLHLTGSVGTGGGNAEADVRAVQGRLNEMIPIPRPRLQVTGRMNPETAQAIVEFQTAVLGQTPPSGVIEPRGPALMALNDPGSARRWGENRGTASGPALAYPPGVTPSERVLLDRIAAGATAAMGPSGLTELNRLLETRNYGHFKNALNTVGSGQWAGEFGNAVRQLRALGMSSTEITMIFVDAAKSNRGAGLGKLIDTLRSSPSLGASVARLSRLGSVMNVAAVVLCAVEVVNHVNNRRFGPALAEIYGTVMQIGVPWAGFVDGVQGVAYAYAPGLQGRPVITYFFRLLNAINPIGAGKAAVDITVSVFQSALTAYSSGQADIRGMDALVERLRGTPMSLFVEMGESIADLFGGGATAERAPYRGVNPPR